MLHEVKQAPAEADERVIAFLKEQKGESQYWPADEVLLEAVSGQPLYTALTQSRTRMVLEALERGMWTGMTEPAVETKGLSIEHLLPQSWTAHWPLPENAEPLTAAAKRNVAKHT